MEITEKVAYLKGLAEGMELDTEKKEGKLLAAIIDVLDDIALEIADMKADQEELYDGLDAVSDDLEDVEDAVFGEDDEDEEDVYEYEEPEEDEDCYATTCPTCEETIYFDESVLSFLTKSSIVKGVCRISSNVWCTLGILGISLK